MSPINFYHVTQIILQMGSCDQSLVTLSFLREKLSQPQFYKDLTRKSTFFDEWSWFKFNNLWLELSMALKFYTSVAKESRLKFRKILGLIPTFVEATGKKTRRIKASCKPWHWKLDIRIGIGIGTAATNTIIFTSIMPMDTKLSKVVIWDKGTTCKNAHDSSILSPLDK